MQIDVILQAGFAREAFSTPSTPETCCATSRMVRIMRSLGMVSINCKPVSRETRNPVKITITPTAKPP
jgi:hypothetical protein